LTHSFDQQQVPQRSEAERVSMLRAHRRFIGLCRAVPLSRLIYETALSALSVDVMMSA